MSIENIGWAIYWIGAAIIAIRTWVENSRVFYVYGNPPSGLWWGITWPIWGSFAILMWITCMWNQWRERHACRKTET